VDVNKINWKLKGTEILKYTMCYLLQTHAVCVKQGMILLKVIKHFNDKNTAGLNYKLFQNGTC